MSPMEEIVSKRGQDITGMSFGRLKATRLSDSKNRGRQVWECLCSCGVEVRVDRSNLVSGKTASCGCYRRGIQIAKQMIHNESSTRKKNKSPEYSTWTSMIARCYNPKAAGYSSYGGRGIAVRSRWRESFVGFLADMGRRPSLGHSIDRIDNSGNYEPGNCRWTTAKNQQRNRRTNRMITFSEVTLCVSAWAERIGINYDTLLSRLYNGWTLEQALATSKRPNPKKRKLETSNERN